jgi:hypothetical protein
MVKEKGLTATVGMMRVGWLVIWGMETSFTNQTLGSKSFDFNSGII